MYSSSRRTADQHTTPMPPLNHPVAGPSWQQQHSAVPVHHSWNPVHNSYLLAAPSADFLSSFSRWSLDVPDFLLPHPHPTPAQVPYHPFNSPDAAFSPTPSDTSSIQSSESPAPEFPYVICNAPLVAPIPLPYHSPTFLQYDLPDEDEDLSHPPYTRRPHKRKREDEETPDSPREQHDVHFAKRRSLGSTESRHYRPLPLHHVHHARDAPTALRGLASFPIGAARQGRVLR